MSIRSSRSLREAGLEGRGEGRGEGGSPSRGDISYGSPKRGEEGGEVEEEGSKVGEKEGEVKREALTTVSKSLRGSTTDCDLSFFILPSTFSFSFFWSYKDPGREETHAVILRTAVTLGSSPGPPCCAVGASGFCCDVVVVVVVVVDASDGIFYHM